MRMFHEFPVAQQDTASQWAGRSPFGLKGRCPPIRVDGKREAEKHVIPAKAGIQLGRRWRAAWTPAFAGVTKWDGD